jgi:hypothetical protein
MGSFRQTKTIGTFFGLALLLFKNSTSMKTFTNINESIISSMLQNSRGKTDFAIMWGKCSRSLEKIILISFLKLTYCQMSFQNFRSNSNLEPSNS